MTKEQSTEISKNFRIFKPIFEMGQNFLRNNCYDKAEECFNTILQGHWLISRDLIGKFLRISYLTLTISSFLLSLMIGFISSNKLLLFCLISGVLFYILLYVVLSSKRFLYKTWFYHACCAALSNNIETSTNSFLAMLQSMNLYEAQNIKPYSNYKNIEDIFSDFALTEISKMYLSRGIAFKTLNIDLALKDLNKAIELNPNLKEAYMQKVIIFYDILKDYENANILLDTILRKFPQFKTSKCYLIKAFIAEENNQVSEVLSLYNKAINAEPNNVKSYAYLAAYLAQNNDTEQALKNFGICIEKEPEISAWYYNRGLLYQKCKIFEKSIEDMTLAIKKDSNNYEAYNVRGIAYKELGNYAKATEDYNKAIEINPKFAFAYANLAWIQKENKDYKKALKNLSIAIKLDPSLGDAYHTRGYTYFKLKKYKKAYQDIKLAIKKGVCSEGVYGDIAYVLMCLKRKKEAIEYFEQILNINPDIKKDIYLTGYGKLLIVAKDTNEAILKFEESYKYNPNNPDTVINKALCNLFINNFDTADKDFKEYIDMQDFNHYSIVIRELTSNYSNFKPIQKKHIKIWIETLNTLIKSSV